MNRSLTLAVTSLAALLLAVGVAVAAQPTVKGAKNCRVFPADNAWNQRVDALPVAGDSRDLIDSIGEHASAHADFGSGKWEGAPIGIPYVVVSSKTKKRKVSFEYADESDRIRYPIPKNVPIEGGRRSSGDRHVIAIDRSKCKLYELYAAYPKSGGKSWKAGSGAVWSLKSNKLRPAGWTSADAAGLPIFPGLARYDEVARGAIDHALRFTAPRTRRAYVYPARHQAGGSDDPDLPPMGARVRLKPSVDIGSFPKQSRVILTALRRYGAILADNGSAWYFSGAPDSHWDNDDLHSLGRLTGSDFEVVDTSSLPTPGR
ncbi:MAG: hypothetical protein QM648_05240 [Solirubrobacterales bacterium]